MSKEFDAEYWGQVARKVRKARKVSGMSKEEFGKQLYAHSLITDIIEKRAIHMHPYELVKIITKKIVEK